MRTDLVADSKSVIEERSRHGFGRQRPSCYFGYVALSSEEEETN